MLIAPLAAPAPLARAQTAPPQPAPPATPPSASTLGATGQPDPPYPDGAVIESIPPDAIVLSLDETIKLALENNLSIIVQRYQPRTAATLVDVEKSVFDPLLTGEYTRARDEGSGDQAFTDASVPASGTGEIDDERTDTGYLASWLDPLSTGGSYQITVGKSEFESDTSSFVPTFSQIFADETTYDSPYWTVTYTQPLLRNLGREANLWPMVVAQKGLGISESVFRQTVIDTVANAARAYWDLNFAIMQLRTERFSLKLAQDFLEQNRVKVRVGTLAPIEITQAEAGVADREETVIIFESALRAAEDQVRRVIGVRSDSHDWDRPVRPSDPLRLEPIEVDEDQAMQEALQNRPDLEQARLQVEARDAEARARKNLRRWGLDFQGTYGNSDPDRDYILQTSPPPNTVTSKTEEDRTNWTAGLTLSVPIHNRLAKANVTRTENELAQAQYAVELVEQTARVDVSAAVRAVRTTLRRVQTGEVNVRLQREKLDAEQKKFENGMSTSFQVLQFQDDLANAETRENLAKADYSKAQVDLSRVKGTILTELGIMLAPAAGEGAARAQSAALRNLWARPADTWSDPGLRLAERVTQGVRLPADFAFSGGPSAARSARTADWIGATRSSVADGADTSLGHAGGDTGLSAAGSF
jgi:outer membrane protein TolC